MLLYERWFLLQHSGFSTGRIRIQGMKQLTRKQRESRRHRAEILNVAESVFSEKGFFGATIREIARKAEFATATIYKFFKSKEDLYTRMILEKADELSNFVRSEVPKETGIRKKIERFIEAKVAFLLANKAFVKIYFAETRPGASNVQVSLNEEIRKKYEELFQFLTELFSAGIKKGIFIKENPHDLALALDGLTNAFVMSWSQRETESKESILKRIAVVKKIFFEQVRLK